MGINRMNLINDLIQKKIGLSTYEILEKVSDIIRLGVSDKLISHLIVLQFYISIKQLSVKEEQKIDQLLDDAKNAFNNAGIIDKDNAIDNIIDQIYEVLNTAKDK